MFVILPEVKVKSYSELNAISDSSGRAEKTIDDYREIKKDKIHVTIVTISSNWMDI